MGSGIFSIGTSSMTANQAVLDTISHNISNANTPGYSRQEVQLTTQNGIYTGAGFYGRGVKVVTEFAWFAARPSGTEDVYKIYAESFKGVDHLRAVQAEAKEIVDAALRD